MHSILQFTRRPDVTFYANGRIDITSRVAKAIGLHDGDVIDILEEIHGEYFIYIRHHADRVCGNHEATVHATKAGSRNFRCYSSRMCHYILSMHGINGKGAILRAPAGRTINSDVYGPMMALVTRLNLESVSNPQPPLADQNNTT